ncbi:MAG: alpha/beta hydrolase [Steroidobacteraceae bacterium]
MTPSPRRPGLALAPLLLVLLAAAGDARASPASPALALTPCRLQNTPRTASYAADCGTLVVAEKPGEAGGRTIGLFVARVPAISGRKAPDPLFLVAGGPGQATTNFYASLAPVFERIRRDRDIVLVDQRGTGRSHRLACDFDEESLMRADRATIAQAARACRVGLQKNADLRLYSTSVAVRDLERVRVALGYGRINLYGISYGTRVVQHYVRRNPGVVRAVILDGVVDPQRPIGPALATDAEAALERILRRCAEEPACHAQFGDPVADYRALRKALAAKPVTLRLADPGTGESYSLTFTDRHLAVVLRIASYSAEQAALLPLALHRAHALADWTALGSQYLLIEHALGDELAIGMHNSVVCTEDMPFVDTARIDRQALANTFIGAAQLDGLEAICSAWPRGWMDSDFRAPLKSSAAALLLSGSDDPVTPPAYAAQAATGFTDALHVILNGLGHGQLMAPCVNRVMADFIAAGTTRALDVACTRRVTPTPFFTTLAGPEP